MPNFTQTLASIKMYRTLLLIPLSVILFSCLSDNESKNERYINEETKESDDTELIEPNFEPELGTYFFEFDQVNHYSTNISEEEIDELLFNENKSESEELFELILTDYYPEDLSNLDFIKKLENFGYTNSLVSEDKHDELNELFRERKNVEIYEYSCIPYFRDILIFKKKSEVIGIAKICFTCEQFQIIGSEANTESFGMSGEYQSLNQLLMKN